MENVNVGYLKALIFSKLEYWKSMNEINSSHNYVHEMGEEQNACDRVSINKPVIRYHGVI